MVRKLDVYLKKVGAWTMEEVYGLAWKNWTNGLRRRKSRLPIAGKSYKKPKGQVAPGSTEKGKGINYRLLKTRSEVVANQTSTNWL